MPASPTAIGSISLASDPDAVSARNAVAASNSRFILSSPKCTALVTSQNETSSVYSRKNRCRRLLSDISPRPFTAYIHIPRNYRPARSAKGLPPDVTDVPMPPVPKFGSRLPSGNKRTNPKVSGVAVGDDLYKRRSDDDLAVPLQNGIPSDHVIVRSGPVRRSRPRPGPALGVRAEHNTAETAVFSPRHRNLPDKPQLTADRRHHVDSASVGFIPSLIRDRRDRFTVEFFDGHPVARTLLCAFG